MNVEVSAKVERELSRLALTMGKKESELAAAVLEAYVADERDYREAVEEGLRSAERGEWIVHEEIEARIERLLGKPLT